MFNQSRKVVALGLMTAVVGSGVAIAGGTTGVELNEPTVEGKVTPSKLDNRKFKPVNLLLGVINSPDSTGNPNGNAAAENIQVSKNVKVNLSNTALCPVELANGTTTEFARDTCPGGSFIGSGIAEVHAPGSAPACGANPANPPCVIAEPVVSVFHGPTLNKLQLHTYSASTGAASPVVDSFIVDATAPGYRQALNVPVAPNTGSLKITGFNATVERSTKVAKAKCKPRTFKFLRTVTYKDTTSEQAPVLEQKCRVQR